MHKPIVIIDKLKRSQNNCGKFTIPYILSKKLNYGQKYMVLIIPLTESEYKFNKFQATVEGLKVITDQEK